MVLDVHIVMTGLVFVPMLAALVIFLSSTRGAGYLATLTALVQVVLGIWLTYAILRDGATRYALGGWSPPLGISLYADGISTFMILMTSLVGATSTIYATGYFSAARSDGTPLMNGRTVRAFWPLWLIMWSALNALFLSGDLFNLYVTLEMVTLAAVALIGLAGGRMALVAAMRYLIAAMTGSLLYLLGVALIYGTYGTVAWDQLAGIVKADATTLCAASLMTVGLMIKTALFPLHYWLPDAHASAPAPVSGVLSGLVLKGSFFIILRLWFYVFAPVMSIGASQLLCTLGMVAILWGSIHAIRQERVKQMIAYSTLSQIGYLFLIFGIWDGWETAFAWRGTAYFMFAHACAKASAFMVAGSLMFAVGSDQIKDWVSIGRREPLLIFTFALAGVNLMGLPPSGEFIAKWMLLNAAVAGGHWLVAAVILLGGLLAAVYVFRLIAVALSSEKAPTSLTPLTPIPPAMRWPPLILAATMIASGVLTTQPLRLLEIGVPVVEVEEAGP